MAFPISTPTTNGSMSNFDSKPNTAGIKNNIGYVAEFRRRLIDDVASLRLESGNVVSFYMFDFIIN